MALPAPHLYSGSDSYEYQYEEDNANEANNYDDDDVMSVKSADSVATNATAIFDQIFSRYQTNIPNTFGSILPASPIAAKHVTNKQQLKAHQFVTVVPQNMPQNNNTASKFTFIQNDSNNMDTFDSLSQINGMTHGMDANYNTVPDPAPIQRSSSAKKYDQKQNNSNAAHIYHNNYNNTSMSPTAHNSNPQMHRFANNHNSISPRSHLNTRPFAINQQMASQRPVYQKANSNPNPHRPPVQPLQNLAFNQQNYHNQYQNRNINHHYTQYPNPNQRQTWNQNRNVNQNMNMSQNMHQNHRFNQYHTANINVNATQSNTVSENISFIPPSPAPIYQSRPQNNVCGNQRNRNSINNLPPSPPRHNIPLLQPQNNSNNLPRLQAQSMVNMNSNSHSHSASPYFLSQSMSPTSSTDEFGARQCNSQPNSPNMDTIANMNHIPIHNNAAFVPPSPSPIQRQVQHNNNMYNTHSDNVPAAATPHTVNLNMNSKKPNGVFISLWDEDNTTDEDSDYASSSSSDSWLEQQKLSALTSFSTIEATPKHTVAKEASEASSPPQQYVIDAMDAIFNIKKYEDYTPDLPAEPVEECTETDHDPNAIQLQSIIWSVTNPYNNNREVNGSKIRDVLLLCHPIFTDSVEILALLQKRFLVRDNVPDAIHWQIQSKVCAFLQAWMRCYYYQDFELYPDSEMKVEMLEFIENMREFFNVESSKGNAVFSKGYMLPDMIAKTMKVQKDKIKMSKAHKLLGSNVAASTDTFVKKGKNDINDANYNKKFLSLDAKKIAQQITLLAFDRFRAIEARECLNQNWKKPDKELRAPNIIRNVEFFNDLSKYISMSILSASSVKQRSKCIRKWIKIGCDFFDLHNFESLAAIQGALTSNPIHKLKKEWKVMPQKYMNKFKEFKVIYARQKNSSNLRKIVEITPPPMIPYTGVFLQDLFVTEEANKTKMKDGTINFTKLMALHSLIQRIQLLQNTKYCNIASKNENIAQFIIKGIRKYKHLTSQEIYNISVSLTKSQKK